MNPPPTSTPGSRRPVRTATRRPIATSTWADEKPPEKPGDVVFPDKEDSNWA